MFLSVTFYLQPYMNASCSFSGVFCVFIICVFGTSRFLAGGHSGLLSIEDTGFEDELI